MTIRGVMITDGGPHPADKWAEATASMIVDIADHVAGEKRGAAIKLQAAVIDVLEKHHTTVQAVERANPGVGALDPNKYVSINSVVTEIIGVSIGTPWEADFANPEFAVQLSNLLASHLATSMHIERLWHQDRTGGK